jgi:excinuclease ABC subunit C
VVSEARALVPRLPTQPGVYRFRDERGRALYIGRATDLRRRVASYWGDLRDRWHLRRMVAKIASVEAVPCQSVHEAAWLERNLLERAKPYWNRTRGGQEVPVYVRLDTTPGRPGLSIVHSGQRPGDFGPYLGGLKVRTAVSALDRVLPLAYAGERLDGSARDMARVRGIEAGSRDRLIGVISGLLRREDDALDFVRGELERRRDAAAAELAFELAAKLQAELEAVEWVIAPQRVTDDTHADIDLHGWADGVVVSFELRGGRVCRWSQRPAPVAPPQVSSTPAQWQPFVTEAAQLAARLRWAPADD